MPKHPDYDIEFKPAIARYDWDQTYDVLEFVYLPEGFGQLMDLCGIPAFELMAIDRFTPYNYLWADQYSQKVYDFCKRFNFSPHNSIYERLLEDENGNNITVPAFELENTQVHQYDPILANFSKGKYQITGLIYQGSQEGLTGSIPTINQAVYTFTLAESTEVDINKIIWNLWLRDDYEQYNSNRFCSNSLVISKLVNDNWVDYTPSFQSKPAYLLYSDSVAYFSNIEKQLVDYFQAIHDDFIGYFTNKFPDNTIYPLQNYLEKIYTTATYGQIWNDELNISHFFNQYSWESGGDFPSLLYSRERWKINNYKYVFKQIPFTNVCYLAVGNNNKWSTGVNYGDLGINYRKELNFNLHHTIQTKDFPNLPLYRYAIDSYRLANENVVFARKPYTWLSNTIADILIITNLYRKTYYPVLFTTIPFYCSTTEFNYFIDLFYRVKIADSCYEQYRIGQVEAIHPFYQSFSDTTEIYILNKVFTQDEWEELYEYNAMTDQEYLAYLLELKEQYEEDSKTW